MTEPTTPAAAEAPALRTFTMVHNGKTSMYDLHAAGCAHLALYGSPYGRYAHLDVNGNVQAVDHKAAKVEIETKNDGIYVGRISPCAK